MTAQIMSFGEYQAMGGLNWSLLKRMADSPAAYRYHRDNPGADPDTYSRGALRAVHARVLEGKKTFDAEFTLFDGRRQGPAWEAALAEAGSRTVLNVAEACMVSGASEAILRNPTVRELLAGTHRELSLQWLEAGRWMKGRVDACSVARRIIVDLKCVPSTKARPMAAEVARRGYHGQLAHYAQGLSKCYGVPVEEFTGYIVAYEATAPWDVAVYELDKDSAMFQGEAFRGGLLARLLECEALEASLREEGLNPLGAWGPREKGIQQLILPAWAPGQTEDEGEEDHQWQE